MTDGTSLQAALQGSHSKVRTQAVAAFIGENEAPFAELMQLLLGGEPRTAQRAAWVVSHCADRYPHLLRPHLAALIQNLTRPHLPDGVKRNTLRVLQQEQIPEALQGILADTCLRLVADPTEAVAIRACAISVVGNLARHQPDLLQELRLLIEDQLPYASPAFLARARQVLTKRLF